MKIFINNFKCILRKILIRNFYRSIKIIFPKNYILKKYGLIAFGERNRIRKNPLWATIDWLGNPDILLNLNEKEISIPIKENSCNCVYSSHNLEHISYDSALAFFDQAKRILKVNGELLLDIPCARRLIK